MFDWANKDLQEHFWSYVIKTETCWLWKTEGGRYGQFYFKSNYILAHRASWILNFGAIPEDLWVLHKCDTPRCVRPDHLFLGTQSDNINDMYAKGRRVKPKGELHPHHKLIEKDILRIRKLWSQGGKQKYIAKLFKIHPSAVSRIINRKRWNHI